MAHMPRKDRYEATPYRRLGNSGLKLPPVSLGLWHNFGGDASQESCTAMVLDAFDLGITHFDLANNYGPPAGAAETTLGKILGTKLAAYRDELVISTKAGYDMWPGPYGDFGSRKYLLSSLDQSLRRMGLDYVDIFYHHRPDPDTPLEETMGALDQAVRSGKALYVGLSNYDTAQMKAAAALLKDLKTPFIVNQMRYHMFDRQIEESLIPAAEQEGIGLTVYSPLAQGLLTNRYLDGVPGDSRAGGTSIFLNEGDLTESRLSQVKQLGEVAKRRGQTIAQLALAFVLRHDAVASVIIGASRPSQVADCHRVIDNLDLSEDELNAIEIILDE